MSDTIKSTRKNSYRNKRIITVDFSIFLSFDYIQNFIIFEIDIKNTKKIQIVKLLRQNYFQSFVKILSEYYSPYFYFFFQHNGNKLNRFTAHALLCNHLHRKWGCSLCTLFESKFRGKRNETNKPNIKIKILATSSNKTIIDFP